MIVVSITGPVGSGKTTLTHKIMNMVDDGSGKSKVVVVPRHCSIPSIIKTIEAVKPAVLIFDNAESLLHEWRNAIPELEETQ